MSRRDDLSSEDRRIWARVTASVTPPVTRKAPRISSGPPAATPDRLAVVGSAPPRPAPSAVSAPKPERTPALAHRPRGAPEPLEPRRQRRLSRERDPIEARLDLHGHGRFQAQDALTTFLLGAQSRGCRAVLVITGQGRRGGAGVIRASVHEWLQAPILRGVVSGFAPAARKHGGEGAVYVTLRRG